MYFLRLCVVNIIILVLIIFSIYAYLLVSYLATIILIYVFFFRVEHRRMSQKVNTIEEIDDSKETWKMVVRITNIWTRLWSQKQINEIIFMNKKATCLFNFGFYICDWLLI